MKTLAGTKQAREVQTATDTAWKIRKAQIIALIKSGLEGRQA